MTSEATETYICVVCREHVAAAMSSECNWCGGRYHLNQRNDIEAKDCGQVWVDEQFLALQFACNTCLAGEGGGGEAAPAAAGRAATRPARVRDIAPPRRRRYRRRA